MRRPRLLAFALASLVVVGGLLAWKGDKVVDRILELRYGGVPPAPTFARPRDTAEANRQDIEYLARLLDYDRSFSDEARVEFTRRLAKLKEGAATMSRGELLMGVAKAVAAADNPHTNVERSLWRAMLNSAPVRFEWFEEGLFVVRAREDQARLLGARVLAIDGMSPELIVRDASKYFGGPPEHGRVSSLLVMESPQALHVLYPTVPADKLVVSLDDVGGQVATVELPAVDPREAPPVVRPGRLLSPESEFGEGQQVWKGVLDRNVPPSLREPSRNLYVQQLAPDTLYLHLWSVHSDSRGLLGNQIVAALDQRPRWRRILIDVRFNTGGDYPDLLDAMKELPSHLAPEGKVIVIEDNTTFSAAIITAALVRHFVPERSVIVGERPRDRLVFWAEGNEMELPNSKIDIPIATGMHDWARGCRDWSRCHWPNIWHGAIGVGSVEPDVKVSWSFDDYRRGRDTVLETATRQ